MKSLVTRDHDKCQQRAMTMDKLNIAFFKLAWEKVSDMGGLILSFKKANKAKSLIAVTVVSEWVIVSIIICKLIPFFYILAAPLADKFFTYTYTDNREAQWPHG